MQTNNRDKYYHLHGNSITMTTYVKAVNQTYDSLILGAEIDEEDEDLPYIYTYHDPENYPLVDYFEGPNIMSKKMLNILIECGVKNIQVLPLQFVNKQTEEIRDDYVVYNILGLVPCAVIGECDATPLGDSDYFKSLLIDPKTTNGLLVFRMKNCPSIIVIHESIAEKLKENDIQGILLTRVT